MQLPSPAPALTPADLQKAADRMSKARVQLLLDKPFFGTLALRLKVGPLPGVQTMGTDGTTLVYEPSYVLARTDAELRGLWAHEVLHCALGHPWRMGQRNPRKWNKAADYAINARLTADGFKLPDGGLVAPPEWENKAAEEIYRGLPDDDEDGNGGNEPGPGDVYQPGTFGQPDAGQDQGQGAGEGPGQPDDTLANTPGPMTEAKWKVAAEQAAMAARKAGDMSGDLDRTLAANRKAETPWREVLRDFLAPLTPNTPTYNPANRRFIWQGIILPGRKREDFPRIGVAVDTSGSVDPEMLATFGRELSTILAEVRPERIDVVYCDSRVRGFESFEPDSGDVVMHAAGGGGTRFQPALDHFNNDPDGPPAAVIYLTDLEGPAPEMPTAYEVLWAVPEGNRHADSGEVPFGRHVKVRVDR